MAKEKPKLTPEDLPRINAILQKDRRVELIPTKNGIVAFQVERTEVKGDTAERR